MSSLYYINMEILHVEGSINSNNFRIEQKREEIERLEEALEKLGDSKSEFFDNYELCREPEFSSKTFHGNNADDIDDLRKKELLVSYVALYYSQINEANEQISEKIDSLEEEIGSLQDSNASLATQHANLKADKREAEKVT